MDSRIALRVASISLLLCSSKAVQTLAT
jgi:hypothetical protein